MQIDNYNESLSSYLRDESGLVGQCSYVAKAQSIEDVSLFIKEHKTSSITAQGARTSITGSSVPFSDYALDLSPLKNIHGLYVKNNKICLKVECGVTLDEISTYLCQSLDTLDYLDVHSKKYIILTVNDKDLFFPCDPSQGGASIGGMIATNASGINAFKYGRMREHINYLHIVDADGLEHHLYRDQNNIKDFLLCIGKDINESYLKDLNLSYKSDAIDLICASEGKLCIILEAGIILNIKPSFKWSLLVLSDNNDKLYSLASKLSTNNDYKDKICCIEYADTNCIELFNEYKDSILQTNILDKIDSRAKGFLYIEYEDNDEASCETLSEYILTLALELGINEEHILAANEDNDIKKLRLYRTGLSEIINSRVSLARIQDSNVYKCASDFEFSFDDDLKHLLSSLEETLNESNVCHCLFMHVPQRHVHINFICASLDEMQKAQAILLEIAKSCLTPVCEHGIGKIKDYLKPKLDEKKIHALETIKNVLDKDHRLNPDLKK